MKPLSNTLWETTLDDAHNDLFDLLSEGTYENVFEGVFDDVWDQAHDQTLVKIRYIMQNNR